MITFRTGISILITYLTPFLSTAQTDSTSIPPPVEKDLYSFEMADSFVHVKKYECAVWTYINLFPKNPDSVVKQVRLIRPRYWDGDLPSFIQTTFAHFAPMDPEISTFDFNGPTLDSAQLKIKAGWSNALIQRLAVDSAHVGTAGKH